MVVVIEKVVIEEDRVKVFINQSFYDIEEVKQVKKSFDNIGKVIIVYGRTITAVDIIPFEKLKPEELEMVGYEFYNHLLNAVIERRGE